MLRARMCVDPARECPHQESLEIQQRTATMLRARAQVRGRSASSPKDSGASRSTRVSTRARGPIVAMRDGRREMERPHPLAPLPTGEVVLTPWPPLPSGEGERKGGLYARGIAETAGDGRTGARFPPGPSDGGDPGSRGDGVRPPRGAARARGWTGGAAAGRRGSEARVHRTARRGPARAAESAAQVSVRGWEGSGAREHGTRRAAPAAGHSRDQPSITN